MNNRTTAGARAETRPVSDDVDNFIAKMRRDAENPDRFPGLRTGLDELDEHTLGLQPGNLIVIASRRRLSRTAFALNIARHVALEQNRPAAFFSPELPVNELMMRLLAIESGVPLERLAQHELNDDQSDRVREAAARTRQPRKIIINDYRPLALETVTFEAHSMKSVHADLALLVVDGLQRLQTEEYPDSREDQASHISAELKRLPAELGLPVVVCCPLERDSERAADNRPTLDDLAAEWDVIGQHADLVLMLHETPEDGVTRVVVAKHRNGPATTPDTDIKLHFDRATLTFAEVGTTGDAG